MPDPIMEQVNRYDIEECERCNELEDICAFHLGVVEGIEYIKKKFTTMMEDFE